MSCPLVSVAEFAAYRNETFTAGETTSLQILISQVSAAIEKRTGRAFARRTLTTVVDAPYSDRLQLNQYPYAIDSTLRVWLNTSANGDPSLFTSEHELTRYARDGYRPDPDPSDNTQSVSGALFTGDGRPWGVGYRGGYGRLSALPRGVPGAVKVVAGVGYLEVPADVKLATMKAVTGLQLSLGTIGPATSESLNGYSIAYAGATPETVNYAVGQVWSYLSAYARVPIA